MNRARRESQRTHETDSRNSFLFHFLQKKNSPLADQVSSTVTHGEKMEMKTKFLTAVVLVSGGCELVFGIFYVLLLLRMFRYNSPSFSFFLFHAKQNQLMVALDCRTLAVPHRFVDIQDNLPIFQRNSVENNPFDDESENAKLKVFAREDEDELQFSRSAVESVPITK